MFHFGPGFHAVKFFWAVSKSRVNKCPHPLSGVFIGPTCTHVAAGGQDCSEYFSSGVKQQSESLWIWAIVVNDTAVNLVMPGSRSSTDPEHKSPRESGEDSEDESEILEESPCGRWLKRREEVGVCFA